MNFLRVAAFRRINPMGWIMALTAITAFTAVALDVRVKVLAVIGAASTSIWTAFGLVISRCLTAIRRRTVFNWTMAALLIGSVGSVSLKRSSAAF